MPDTYFMNPGGAIAVAEAGYKMWKSGQEARERKETKKLLKAISAKLDIVISKQDEILTELKNMKVFFQEELRKQFLHEVQYGMASHRDSLEVITSLIGVDNKAALERVRELELPTRNFSFNLLQRGVAAFTIALAAAVVHVAVINLLRELGVKERVARPLELGFLDKWEEHFLRWFNPDAEEGILYPLRLLKEAREKIQKQIEGYPRRIDKGYHRTDRYHYSNNGRTQCEIHRQRFLVITGDITSGFADHLQEGPDVVSNRCTTEHWNRWGPSAGAVPDILFEDYDFADPLSLRSRDELLKAVPTSSYYDNAREIAFGKTRSGVIPVNASETQMLNAWRLQWVGALEAETNFAAFVKIVQDTRAEFAARAKLLRG